MDLDPQACYRAIATRDPRFDGRLFIGVTSTGIYCRPICPARTPKPENCRFFAAAAAAQEAGFRPCLRCRPEISPELAAWHGSSNTVRRALALIAEGALDGDDDAVPALAERLGVGERQLRRLFHRHLGASPIAVAQTRRVLFAKQLIHETKLPMTEVALASGFGSVRRFNHIFRALFGRPPRELRRGAQRAGDAAAITLALPYAPPYDWPAMLAFLSTRTIPGVECVAQGRYCRTIALEGAHGWVEVAPDDGRPTLRATIRFPSVRALPTIVARLRRVLDLNADIRAIGAHLAGDAHLAPLIAARPGLRVPGAWDGFELAVRAVLGQQITVSAATGLAGKLVRAHGTPLSLADAPAGLTHAFPRPEALASADLGALGMPRARGRALSALAAMTAADPRLFAPGRELDDTIARLCELPGIGEWTAQYIAMRGLREPDAFPAADIGLLRALEDAAGRRPKPAELLARAEAWRPWRAYAALHLWAADTHRSNANKVAPPRAAPRRKEKADVLALA
jgi:AraC family transcriptional regulator, regulatory protein of adaptative response / DNA-3-methyladenine glycosylase II